jgi:hypothetical protein
VENLLYTTCWWTIFLDVAATIRELPSLSGGNYDLTVDRKVCGRPYVPGLAGVEELEGNSRHNAGMTLQERIPSLLCILISAAWESLERMSQCCRKRGGP